MSNYTLIELTAEAKNGRGYHYQELELPASQPEILDALHKLGRLDEADGYLDINIIDCPKLPALTNIRLDDPTLKELNFFAERLNTLEAKENAALKGIFNVRAKKTDMRMAYP